jgi:hypothetical protein
MDFHNRKVRKRNRRRNAEAEATAGLNIVERWGWGEPAPQVASDLALLRQAIREAWPVPETTCKGIMAAIMHLLNRADTPVRVQIAAMRAVLDMEWANLASECKTVAQRRRLLKGKSPAWRRWRSEST